MKSNNFPLYFVIAFGCCFLIGSLFSLVSAIDLDINGQIVDGLISRQVQETCTDTDSRKQSYSYTCYRPFVTYSFDELVYEAGMSTRSGNQYVIGSEVVLLVNPRSPTKPEFKETNIWGLAIGLFLFGVPITAVGIFFLREDRKMSAQHQATFK